MSLLQPVQSQQKVLVLRMIQRTKLQVLKERSGESLYEIENDLISVVMSGVYSGESVYVAK